MLPSTEYQKDHMSTHLRSVIIAHKKETGMNFIAGVICILFKMISDGGGHAVICLVFLLTG